MALTRKFLTALGIENDKIESIIDAHTETVDALKKERDDYKAEADKIPNMQKELDKAKAAAKDSGEYDKLKKEFDDYKADVAGKETLAKKKAALEKLCKAKDGAYLSESGVAKAVKYHDFDKIELDENGEIKDAKELVKSLREEWKEYVQTEQRQGAKTANPPAGDGGNGGEVSRAAQLYQQHRASLYGVSNESKGDSK